MSDKIIEIGDGWRILRAAGNEYVYLFQKSTNVGDVNRSYNIREKKFYLTERFTVPKKYENIFRVYCFGIALHG